MQEILEVKKQITEIEQKYKELMGEQTYFSCLLMGIFGSGKTRCACTGRLPILIDMFDPRGGLLLESDPVLKQLRAESKLKVRPFWNENSQNPSEYQRWERQWQEDCKSGFLSLFGTYVIDSGTSWLEAMSNYISRKKGGKRNYELGGKIFTGNLEIQDYIPMYNMVMDMIKITSSQGCDFIYTAHLLLVEDEVTGKVTAVLDTYKRLRSKIPKLFSEKYVVSKKETSQGPIHELLIHSTGKYEASSQLMSSGKLGDIEEPNIKKLLEKAGLNTQDKPITWK